MIATIFFNLVTVICICYAVYIISNGSIGQNVISYRSINILKIMLFFYYFVIRGSNYSNILNKNEEISSPESVKIWIFIKTVGFK